VPTHYDITLSVDKKGNFTYSPTHLRARPNDTVSFVTSPAGLKFEVMFKNRSPGNRTHIRHDTPQDQGGEDDVRPGQLECGDDYGLFKYAAAIFDGTNVFIDTGCGDIGVDN
jgi:hypothetical protein